MDRASIHEVKNTRRMYKLERQRALHEHRFVVDLHRPSRTRKSKSLFGLNFWLSDYEAYVSKSRFLYMDLCDHSNLIFGYGI